MTMFYVVWFITLTTIFTLIYGMFWLLQRYYLICSNSRNKWIFEISNHSNHSNGQVLLSFFFSCYNVSLVLPISSHGASHSRESSFRLEWVYCAVTFQSLHIQISPPWGRKCQNKRLNYLDNWPTYCCCVHSESVSWPGPWFTDDDKLFDCSQGC